MANVNMNTIPGSPLTTTVEGRVISDGAARVLTCLRAVRRGVAADSSVDRTPPPSPDPDARAFEIAQEWEEINRKIEARRSTLRQEQQESAVMVVRLADGEDSLEQMLCQLERDCVNTDWAEIFSRDSFGFGALRVHGPSSILRKYAKLAAARRFFPEIVESLVKDDQSGEDRRHRVVVRLTGHGDKPGLMLSVVATIRRHSGVFAFDGNSMAIAQDEFAMQFVASVEGNERVESLITALRNLGPTHGITVEFAKLEPAKSEKPAGSCVSGAIAEDCRPKKAAKQSRAKRDRATREKGVACVPSEEPAGASC
jgi:hypothetical protein